MKRGKTLGMHSEHPWLRVIFGRCGSGKSTTARQIMAAWRSEGGGKIFAVDPVASVPPSDLHIAGESDLYSYEMPDDGIPPQVELVVVDEADLYLSQGDAYRKPLPPLHALVRRRRHEGVSLLLISQRPALIARTAFSLADEIIVCSTTDPRDLAELGKLPGVTKEDLARVAAMSGPGIALIWTPQGVERGGSNGASV